MAYKLGILTTHPIQYQIPWFRALHSLPEIDLTVFFCMIPNAHQQGEGFGVAFKWDIPLLDGYNYKVLDNNARFPAVTTFCGCDTPGIDSVVRGGLFDAFIINGWHVKSCLQSLWACKKNKIPCIVRGESNALRPRAWWKQLLHRLLLKQYDAFLNIGKSNKEFYINNGVSEKKIFFAPYCVDNKYFNQISESMRSERESIRLGWNISQDARTFLFCAKFIEKKKPFDLIKAFSIAGNTNPAAKIHLLMVGDGDLKKECEEYAKVNNLPVTFTGFLNQSEIPKAYIVADLMVLPSDHGETWGLVINEGMACGLPAIVSDQVGSHLDLIIENQTGAVYPYGNIHALADRIASFASKSDSEVRKMGEFARERVNLYSYEEVMKGTIAAVEAVCRQK